jgi:hypothetical protein
MTVEVFASRFSYPILRGNHVLQGGVHVKARRVDLFYISNLICLKALVVEDLIQNVHILFDERSSQFTPVPSSNVAETTSAYTSGPLFLSHELPQSTTQHPGPVDGIPMSTQLSFSSLLTSDVAADSRRGLSPAGLLRLPSSKTLTEGLEVSTQEQVIPEERRPKAAETLAGSNPAEVVPAPLTSVTEWRLYQSRLPPQAEALTIPRPRACYRVRRTFRSLLPRACKLGWGDSPHGIHLFSDLYF